MWTAKHRHNWIWRNMFIEINVKNTHIFQKQKFRRTSRQPRFAENTLENQNVDMIMFCHIKAVMSMRSRAVRLRWHVAIKACIPGPWREEVWTGSHLKLIVVSVPSSVNSYISEGEERWFAAHWEVHSLNPQLKCVHDWYLYEAREKHLSGYGGGGNWTLTSQMSLIFILAL